VILLLTSLSLSSWLGRETQDFTVLYAAALNTGNDSFSHLRLILGIAGLALGSAAVLASEIVLRSRHNRAVEREAQELGLAFSAEARPFEGSDVCGLPLLQGDSSANAENVVQATIDGRRALVLELPSCEVCEAETPHPHLTTVAAFRCPGRGMPEFEIARKSLLSKLGDVLLRKAPVIEDREFANEFFVHCREPEKVHDWLTPEKLAKLRLAASPFHISANAEWILIFNPGAQIPPEQYPAFLRETSKIADALLR